MKGRSLFALVVVAFGLGGSIATLGWLASGYKNEAVLSSGQSTWTEVAWPFAPDKVRQGQGISVQRLRLRHRDHLSLYPR